LPDRGWSTKALVVCFPTEFEVGRCLKSEGNGSARPSAYIATSSKSLLEIVTVRPVNPD